MFVLTDGLIGRCGFEVASLDDLSRQLSCGRVVDESQQDLRQRRVLSGAVGQSSGAAGHAHHGAATLQDKTEGLVQLLVVWTFI